MQKFANAEFEKELKVLEKNFGIDVSTIREWYKTNGKVAGKWITQAYNTVLQYKEIYERTLSKISYRDENYNWITRDNQIDLGGPVFYDYMTKEITSAVRRNYEKNIAPNAANMTPEQIAAELIDENMVNEAIWEVLTVDLATMKNSTTKDAQGQKDNREAYAQFSAELRKWRAMNPDITLGENPIVKQIFQNYNLDEMLDKMRQMGESYARDGTQSILGLAESMTGITETTRKNKKTGEEKSVKRQLVRSATIQKHISNSASARGTLVEIMQAAAFNVMYDSLAGGGSNYDVKSSMHAYNTGAAGSRSDVTIIGGLSLEKIEAVLESTRTTLYQREEKNRKTGEMELKTYRGRAAMLEAQRELYNKLSNIDTGFVIFSQTKSYQQSTIEGGRKGSFNEGGGFSAGESMTVKEFARRARFVPGGGSDAVGRLINLLDGAIMDDKKQDVADEIATYVSAILFDDVMAIGRSGTSASDHFLHMLYLDGAYVPMSFVFQELADTFTLLSMGEGDLSNLVRVEISTGAISYPTGNPDGSFQWTTADWKQQQNDALSNIKIKTFFLKGFSNLMNSLK